MSLDGPQIERGRPIALLDALNHYIISLPSKLILLNWNVLDHELPAENERILEHYLELNQLRSVKVRHNQWDPIGELKRLVRNEEVGAGYRYTLGVVTWLLYTLFPDRVFGGLPFIGGGDHFNPFSNTVNVYSSDVTILIHEGGHAKDYLTRDWRGTTFALMRLLPGIDLIQEAKASGDAIRYLHCIRDQENELRAYRTLIPAYSTYVGGYFQAPEVTLPIVALGHVSGRVQAWRRAQAMASVGERPGDHVAGYHKEDFLPDWCVPLDGAESRWSD